MTVRTNSRLNTPEDFNNLIIKEDGFNVVKFQDIGTAELAPENFRTALKRDGIPMVMPNLIAQPGSNHIEIAEEFYQRFELIKKDLPEDVEAEIV